MVKHEQPAALPAAISLVGKGRDVKLSHNPASDVAVVVLVSDVEDIVYTCML